jgi:hypothetical protein
MNQVKPTLETLKSHHACVAESLRQEIINTTVRQAALRSKAAKLKHQIANYDRKAD